MLSSSVSYRDMGFWVDTFQPDLGRMLLSSLNNLEKYIHNSVLTRNKQRGFHVCNLRRHGTI